MTFVVTAPTAPADEPALTNGSFWPEVEPTKVRASQRIDSTITPDRLKDALIEAMASVNGELAVWRATQEAASHATLAGVPAETIDQISIHVHRYLRAVGCLAKALLVERYRDFDSTGAGNKKADQLEDPIDDLRRDARWAISDIQGLGRTTVELI